MSEVSQGPGWWLASDGRWYPPEQHPGRAAPTPPPTPAFTDLPSFGAPAGHAAAYPQPGAAYPPPGQWPAAYAQPPRYPMQAYRPQPFGPPAAPPSGGRIGRGLRLVRTGFTMVREEPGLLAVPVVAFLVELAVIGLGALLALPGLVSESTTADGGATASVSAWHWIVLVATGIVVMFVSVVSHATIIGRVMARFHGQRVTNRQALAGALAKSPQLFVWAVVNYVVMSILRNIRRQGIIGLVIGSLVRVAWTLASFFVVPVILYENLGPFAAIKRSTGLCRQRWGENIVGNSAVAVIAFLAVLVDVAVAGLLGAVFVPLGVAVGVLGLVAIVLVVTVASASFNAALYWFAVTGESPGGFSAGDLQAAYRPSSRRAGAFGS